MGFVKPIEFGIQLCHVVGRWIFILGPEMTLQRAVNFRSALERRGKITSPGAKNIAAIISDRSIKNWIGGSHEIDDTPAHAKADNTNFAAVDAIVMLKKFDACIDVVDNSTVAQARAAGNEIIFALGPVAMIEVWCRRDVTGGGEPRVMF